GRVLAGRPNGKPSAEHKRELAAIVHLCGAGSANAFSVGFTCSLASAAAATTSQTTSPASEQCSGSSAGWHRKPINRGGSVLASAPEERDEWTTAIRRAERAAGDLAYPDRFGAEPLELPDCSSAPIAAGRRCFIASKRGVLLRPGRARGVKFAVALLDSASPL